MIKLEDDYHNRELLEKEVFELTKKYGVTDFGNYNNLPTPYKLVDPEEFFGHMDTYTPKYMDFRQVKVQELQYLASVRIYFFHDSAYAIYHFQRESYELPSDHALTFNFLVWRIGCIHQYKELSPKESREIGITHWGMCYHVYKCSLCGHIVVQDSSD